MDKEKVEFLDLKRQKKDLKKGFKTSCEKFSKNATNPIAKAFLDFKKSKKFNIEDL